MKPKTVAFISYLTWIGWIVAMVKRDRSSAFTTQHINQALILNLAGMIANLLVNRGGVLAVVGEVADVGVLILLIMGIARAVGESSIPLPIIGNWRLIE